MNDAVKKRFMTQPPNLTPPFDPKKLKNQGEVKKDIYSYIRSQDVAEHCRSIGKTWNTLEIAVIIDRSNHTIAEKHAAWQELIDHYPDMSSMPNASKVLFDSTHKVIAARMEYERKIIEQFKTPGNGAIYTYGPHTWGTPFFTTFEKALADLNETWLKRDDLDKYFENKVANELIDGWTQSGMPYVRYAKTIPDADKYSITGVFDCDGNPYQVWSWVDDDIRDELFPGVTFNMPMELNFADRFFIDIPIPFKRGDLLTCAGQTAKSNLIMNCANQSTPRQYSNVFVLGSFMSENPERLEKCLRGEFADGVEMIGNGMFVDTGGHLFGTEAGSYDCFEYFKGKLEGPDRLLHYVHLFMNDKISLPALLGMERRIIAEESARTNINTSGHGCYLPDQLVYEYYGN